MSNNKGKGKVVIVEDEPALRDIYSTKLEMEGYKVLTAGDGVEGLNVISSEIPDIVLLDVIIPIKDGFRLLQDLKMSPKTERVPVIILSNLGQREDIEHGMQLGAAAYLTKANLTPDQIADKVVDVLSKGEGQEKK